MRVALGATALVQGALYLVDASHSMIATWTGGFLAAASGVMLLFGFLTPVASIVVGLGSLGIALWWLPAPATNLIENTLASLFVVIMSAAILFLGPGAFSVDSYLFGRREIVIPHSPRSPKL
jgi:uncharacterized membrane protein YphA (DoxX/SURF4 family)